MIKVEIKKAKEMIKIEITRTRDSINFEAQLKDYYKRSHYGGVQIPYPGLIIAENKLIVEITEEQFLLIRKSILEVF